jgi:hypothetical protein
MVKMVKIVTFAVFVKNSKKCEKERFLGFKNSDAKRKNKDLFKSGLPLGLRVTLFFWGLKK